MEGPDPSLDRAKYLAMVIQGLSAQARDGASREELHAVADAALEALPLRPTPGRSGQEPA